MKEIRGPDQHGSVPAPQVCRCPSLLWVDATSDVALLKVSLEANREYEWLRDLAEFPYLELSARTLDEAEPVYAFGYPLSEGGIVDPGPAALFGTFTHHPRVTAAIVASTYFAEGMILSAGPPRNYVLDRALNYGNSGGPILAQSTGRAHALCSSFQPVFIPQLHMKDAQGNYPSIVIPSLYGFVTNLSHPSVRSALAQHGLTYADN